MLRVRFARLTRRDRVIHYAPYAAPVLLLLVVLLGIGGCPNQPGNNIGLPPPPPPDGAGIINIGSGGGRPPPLQKVPTIRVLIASGNAIRVSTTGPCRIFTESSTVESRNALAETTLARQGNDWILQASHPGQTLTIEAVGASYVRVGAIYYHGKVVCQVDNGVIIAVNYVDLETYLAGVVGKEMYTAWPLAAYQAQAIAARTYAFYEAQDAAAKPYDLRDDQSSQVYGGASAETPKSWQAIKSTYGIMLGSGPAGQEKAFRAHYSSCCGGLTNSVYVLYGPRVDSGPLVGGTRCDYCQASNRYRWPTVSVAKTVIFRAVAKGYPAALALGKVTGVEVAEEVAGRPVWVDVVGPNTQKVRIRADDLRLCLVRDNPALAAKLCSMNCAIRDAGANVTFENGRGFGHGVGMCQWGAKGMAEAGKTPQEILALYYPGAKLFKAYVP
jgi:stage II sporulation protein D